MVERAPRPGTKTAEVLPYFKSGWSNPEIVQITGLSPIEVRSAKSRIRVHGYLLEVDNPTCVTNVIGVLANMGMCPRETEAALEIWELDVKADIGNALRHGRSRGKFRKLSREEERDIRRDTNIYRHNERLLGERVDLWLEVEGVLYENDIPEVPRNRMEWKLLLEYFKKRRDNFVGSSLLRDLRSSLHEIPGAPLLLYGLDYIKKMRFSGLEKEMHLWGFWELTHPLTSQATLEDETKRYCMYVNWRRILNRKGLVKIDF